MSSLRFGEFDGEFGGDAESDVGSEIGIEAEESFDFVDIDSTVEHTDSGTGEVDLAYSDLLTDLDTVEEQTEYTLLSDGDVVYLHDDSLAELSDLPQDDDIIPLGDDTVNALQDSGFSKTAYDVSDPGHEKEMTNEPNFVGERAPAMPVFDAEKWEELKDVPFAGNHGEESIQDFSVSSSETEASAKEWEALQDVPFAGDSKEKVDQEHPFDETLASTNDVRDLNGINEWLGEINPNYDPFDTESPYANNCGSCAYAVFQRLDGDKDIIASANNYETIEQMNAQTGMEQVAMSPELIEQTLLEQGNGAHAIIGIDRSEGTGHWFNAANLDGKVVAIDGQTGEISAWPPDYGDVVNWDMSIRKEE